MPVPLRANLRHQTPCSNQSIFWHETEQYLHNVTLWMELENYELGEIQEDTVSRENILCTRANSPCSLASIASGAGLLYTAEPAEVSIVYLKYYYIPNL